MARQKKMDYMNTWQKEKCRRFVLVLNRNTQGDVIEFLENNSPFTTTIVDIIRKHINDNK